MPPKNVDEIHDDREWGYTPGDDWQGQRQRRCATDFAGRTLNAKSRSLYSTEL
jgi:hypothetical protein